MNLSIRLRKPASPGQLPADLFEYMESPLDPLEDGRVRLRMRYGSIDAGTRAMLDPGSGYVVTLPPGDTVPMSAAIGEVVETRHPDYTIGMTVRLFMVQRQRFVDFDPQNSWGAAIVDQTIDPLLYLGALGLTGFTAWIGMISVARPVPGETVLVSAAGGAVGSIAGQLGRIAGARVIGIAGGKEKCGLVKREFGFDDCADYRAPNFPERLRALCPDGVDAYFENVGGSIQRLVFDLMRDGGRIALCGQIAQYEGNGADQGINLMSAITKRLRIEGFRSLFHRAELPAFNRSMSRLLQTDAVRAPYTVTSGIENLHEAINSLTSGANFGQQIHAMD